MGPQLIVNDAGFCCIVHAPGVPQLGFDGITFRFSDLVMPSDDDSGGSQHDYTQATRADVEIDPHSTDRAL